MQVTPDDFKTSCVKLFPRAVFCPFLSEPIHHMLCHRIVVKGRRRDGRYRIGWRPQLLDVSASNGRAILDMKNWVHIRYTQPSTCV